MSASDEQPRMTSGASVEGGLILASCLALVGNVGNISLGLAPLIVEGLVGHLGFDAAHAGSAISIEMAGLCIGNLAVLWLAGLLSPRIIAAAGLVLIAIGNLGSAVVTDATVFLLFRFLAGLGGGLTMIVTALLSQMRRPEIGFAIFAGMWIAIISAFSGAVPALFALAGVQALFVAVAVTAILSNMAIILFPRKPADRSDPAADVRLRRIPGSLRIRRVLSCVMVFGYASAIGGVWSYVALIGSARELADPFIAQTLSTTFLAAGLLGSGVAALSSGRLPTSHLVAGACVGLAGAVWWICTGQGAAAYAIAVALFVFFWLLSYSPIFTIQAMLDPSGRLVVLGYLVQMLGFVVGPLVVAAIITPSDFRSLPVVCTGAFLVVVVAIYAIGHIEIAAD